MCVLVSVWTALLPLRGRLLLSSGIIACRNQKLFLNQKCLLIIMYLSIRPIYLLVDGKRWVTKFSFLISGLLVKERAAFIHLDEQPSWSSKVTFLSYRNSADWIHKAFYLPVDGKDKLLNSASSFHDSSSRNGQHSFAWMNNLHDDIQKWYFCSTEILQIAFIKPKLRHCCRCPHFIAHE